MKFQFFIIFSIFICSQLKSQNAYLSIQADVSDATVFINKIEKGKVPYEAMVAPGTYSIRIYKSISVDEEYYYFEKITIKGNDIKKINVVMQKRYTDVYEKRKEEERKRLAEMEKNIKYGSLTDSRDGQIYKTISIGSQTWMAENLAYRTNIGSYWAYDNNNNNVEKYGLLYNWETSKNICPTSWHLPSNNEWTTLITYLNGDEKNAGSKMKTKTGWNYHIDGHCLNSSGFSALPAGNCINNGTFQYLNEAAFFWTSSPDEGKDAYYIYLDYRYDYVLQGDHFRTNGFSIRCVKD